VIPRYQKVLLWLLLAGSVVLAAYLVHLRSRAEDQLSAVPAAAPMAAPVEAAPVQATLMIANDDNGSLAPVTRQLALPREKTTRAKALLNDLFDAYAEPGSPHPLAAVQAVNEVFLLPVPAASASQQNNANSNAQMAVINLNGAFVDRHPSGILVETLTLLSILGTLHANLPQIAEVRFLVDGHMKETLAGHVDLTRTYLTANDVPTVTSPPPAHPSAPASTESAP